MQLSSTQCPPVRVAHMITPFEDAGAERQLLELVKRTDRSRFDPMIYLSQPEGYIFEELKQLDVEVVDVGAWGNNEGATLRMARDLRRRRPQIIHSWMFVANTWARIAGKLAGVPVIITSDRSMDTDLAMPYRCLDAVLSPLSTHVVVNARLLAEHVHRHRGVPWRKLSVIYNGVDLDIYGRPIDRAEARRVLKLPPDRPVVGMVASFRPRKRWDVFLQAISELRQTCPVIGISVGDGEPRARIEQLAASMDLTDSVRFYGVRDDIPRVMAALDVLTLSSDDEGMPNAIMQAMAARRPAVATDAGGTAELIVEGVTGFVVPRGDVRALAGRLRELLVDPARAARFGQAGRERVENQFTFEVCVDQTMALYDRLLLARSPHRRTAPDNEESMTTIPSPAHPPPETDRAVWR